MTIELLPDENQSYYSRSTLSHKGSSPSSYYYNSLSRKPSFGQQSKSTFSHKKTYSKGSSLLTIPKIQQVSTRSVNTVDFYHNNFDLSLNRNYNGNNNNDLSLITESSISSFIHSTTNNPQNGKNMDHSFDKSPDRSYDRSFESNNNSTDYSTTNSINLDDSSINNVRNVNLMLRRMSSLNINNNGLIEVEKKYSTMNR